MCKGIEIRFKGMIIDRPWDLRQEKGYQDVVKVMKSRIPCRYQWIQKFIKVWVPKRKWNWKVIDDNLWVGWSNLKLWWIKNCSLMVGLQVIRQWDQMLFPRKRKCLKEIRPSCWRATILKGFYAWILKLHRVFPKSWAWKKINTVKIFLGGKNAME